MSDASLGFGFVSGITLGIVLAFFMTAFSILNRNWQDPVNRLSAVPNLYVGIAYLCLSISYIFNSKGNNLIVFLLMLFFVFFSLFSIWFLFIMVFSVIEDEYRVKERKFIYSTILLNIAFLVSLVVFNGLTISDFDFGFHIYGVITFPGSIFYMLPVFAYLVVIYIKLLLDHRSVTQKYRKNVFMHLILGFGLILIVILSFSKIYVSNFSLFSFIIGIAVYIIFRGFKPNKSIYI